MIIPVRAEPVREEGQAMTDTHRMIPYAFTNKWCQAIDKKPASMMASGLTYFPSEVQSRVHQGSLGADIIV